MSSLPLIDHIGESVGTGLEKILTTLKSPDTTAEEYAAARELAQELNMQVFEFSQNATVLQFSAAGIEAHEAIDAAAVLEDA